MKRREFIAITGAGVAAALGPEIGYNTYWTLWDSKGFAHDWQVVPRGSERLVPTICQQCHGGCGAVVRMVGDRAVKIDGNPVNPVSRGGFCPKGQSALQALYHPDRIKTPLKRTGERGSGEWESITWEEALEIVTQKLNEIREQDGPHTLAFLDGEESDGLMQVLIKRFLKAYGSPNYISKTSSIMDERMMKSPALNGKEGFYDLSKAEFVLNLGLNFIESSYSPLQTIQAFSKLKEKEVKSTYVGSRRSVTGIKSNEWINANPGSEGLLAIGIAKVMIEKGLYNIIFVNDRTLNFEEFVAVIERFDIHRISQFTGVSEEEIAELARKFSSYGELGVAIGNSGSVADQMAIHSLNILSGSISRLWWDYDGKAIPFSDIPEISLDNVASASVNRNTVGGQYNLENDVFGPFPRNIISNNPYPLSALFIYYSNPLLSVPNSDNVKSALEKVPFIVNFSPFMDETAIYSDIILPDHTSLEKWQDAPQTLIDGTPVLGLRQPIIEPRLNTMNTGDVIIQLAQKIGGSIGEAFPWNDFEEFLRFSLGGVFSSNQGGIADGKNYADFDEWLTALLINGWWNPDGRITFEGNTLFPDDILLRVTRTESRSKEFPFSLNVYKLMTLTKPRNTAQPTLFDIAAPHVYRKWLAWVEINPETAEELGVKDEDWVWVESELGREKFKAKFYEDTLPNVVNIPLIIGSKGYDPWMKDTEQNVFKIVPDKLDIMDGHFIYDTGVKIYKV
jgi:anaerobic selenocysteine-containing dehydrogenase